MRRVRNLRAKKMKIIIALSFLVCAISTNFGASVNVSAEELHGEISKTETKKLNDTSVFFQELNKHNCSRVIEPGLLGIFYTENSEHFFVSECAPHCDLQKQLLPNDQIITIDGMEPKIAFAKLGEPDHVEQIVFMHNGVCFNLPCQRKTFTQLFAVQPTNVQNLPSTNEFTR